MGSNGSTMQRNTIMSKEICLEIGADKDHVHYLVQSVPMYSLTKIVRTIKSITAREIFQRIP